MSTEVAASTPDVPASNGRAWKKRYAKAMKVVRRVHLYLGLALFPFIGFYGITGVLFNHPDIGRGIERTEVSAEELAAATTFRPWKPDVVAARVVEQLNATAPTPYRLDTDEPIDVFGFPILVAPSAAGGRHILAIDLVDGTAEIATHPPRAKAEVAPFATRALPLPEYRMSAVEHQVSDALAKLGIEGAGTLRAHPKAAPELRFVMRDAEGRPWNVTYNLSSGDVDGRRADADSGSKLVEVLGELHKRHHYPIRGKTQWVWALMMDLTGIALVLWALTGLVMWWQLKPTRLIGGLAIVAAVVTASVVMTRNASELQFTRMQVGGP